MGGLMGVSTGAGRQKSPRMGLTVTAVLPNGQQKGRVARTRPFDFQA